MKMPSSSKDMLSERVHTSLRSFHYHARDCQACCDPYFVHLSKTLRLCDNGHALAQDATDALYAKARTTPLGQIDIAFPEGWESVDGLIKSITHHLQGAPSNRIDLEAMRQARTVSSNTARRIEAEREGKITYVSPEGISRGNTFASDLTRRGTIEVPHAPVMGRSRSTKYHRYVDPTRSSGFDLAATAYEQPQRQHASHHSHRTGSRSPREHGSPRSSGRAVSFNPEIEMRYF